jgi:hypothetical protein
MIQRISADLIATALVASYRFDGKDPSALLGTSPSVTLLADAALVIKGRFGLRTGKAAQLCSLTRPANQIRQKLALTFACDKRDRRQAAIEAALREDRLGTALVQAVPDAKPKVDDERAGKAVKGRSDAASAKPISPLDSLSSTKTIARTPLGPVTKASRKPLSLDEAKARLARQKSWARNPTDLPPIPPVVCGTKWTRDYIAERERIKALHRAAGRKVPA